MRKKLTRNKNDKILGGVCSGIAEYFNRSALAVRLIWSTLIYLAWVQSLHLIPISIYILLWLTLRTNKKDEVDIAEPSSSNQNKTEHPVNTGNKMKSSFLIVRFIGIGCIVGSLAGWILGQILGFNGGDSIVKLVFAMIGFPVGAIAGALAFLVYNSKNKKNGS